MSETIENRLCPKCGRNQLRVYDSVDSDERLGVWCETCNLSSLKAYAACNCIEWTSNDFGYHWHGERYAISSDGKRNRNELAGEIEAGSGCKLESPPWHMESSHKVTCQHCGGQVRFWPALDW